MDLYSLINMKNTLFVCLCGSIDHQLVISSFDDELDNNLYFYVHLNKNTFLNRVKYAIKYIFGHQSDYGAFDEILLGREKQIQLVKNINSNLEKTNG